MATLLGSSKLALLAARGISGVRNPVSTNLDIFTSPYQVWEPRTICLGRMGVEASTPNLLTGAF